MTDSPTARPHARKFLAVTLVLVGIAIGALGIAAGILLRGSRSKSPTAPAWSAWSPSDGGIAGEREIANAIAPLYRATPASQLAIVTVQNINDSATNPTGTQLAVRNTSGTLSALPGATSVYSLCGLGPGCQIATGTPSAARLLLLRREALELALYTFKYIGGIENFVAILPPGRTVVGCTGICSKANLPKTTKSVNIAVALPRQALQHFLNQPVRDTLPEPVPPLPEQMDLAPEAELVSVVTAQGLFSQQSVQAQDGSNVLVLDPLPPQ